jgi:predicted TIM-barrel fold metal-dependent hydrolase
MDARVEPAHDRDIIVTEGKSMRIDAYTHFIPQKFFDKLVASGYGDIGKRVQEVPCIYDLDIRRKVVDQFDDYAQILSYPMPPLEVFSKPDEIEQDAKLINDGFVEICAKYPDYFPGWVAQVPMTAPDAGVREAKRALNNGALGVQIYTNIAGRPIDDPAFEPFFAAMNELNKPIWLHPARAANFPDYLSEKKSKYEIWWTFGWSYETAAAMARLVFSGIMDKYPNLKIITHHFGGIVPMLEGRIGPGWDQMGARTSDEDLGAVLKRLKKRPLDYFKHSFYADTATFGGVPAMHAGLAFYDLDKIVFASDCPFDPEKGTMYTRETLRILEEVDMPKADLEKIWHGNLEAICGVKFPT